MAQGDRQAMDRQPKIRKRSTKAGIRYDVRWRPGPGEPEQSRTFQTFESARAWRTQVESAQLQGGRLDPRAGKRRFGNYAAEWLEHRRLSDQTRELYGSLLRNHLLPTFGDLSLARVTPSAVRRWHAPLAARGGVTAAKSYRLLNSIMATVVEDGLIPANPCTVRGASVERSPERRFVEPAVVADLADAIDPRLRAMVLVAAFGGLRLGELRALAVRDFNELAGSVTVSSSIDARGRRKAPKSAAGRREVVLPVPIVQEVAAHVGEFCSGDPAGPLFPRALGGPVNADFVRKRWNRACAEVGVDGAHFHDLRHTAGTLAAQVGATMRELMSRAGHSSSRMALRYQHVAESRDRQIADRMAEFVVPRDGRGIDAPRGQGRERRKGG